MTRTALAPLLGLALWLAACEYPGVAHPLAAAAQAESGPRLSPAQQAVLPAGTGEGRARPGEAQVGAPAQSTVHIAQKDFELDPDNVTAKAGTVTFVLRNEGRYTHDFRVEGQGIDEKGPKVGSGRSLEWQIALKPGEYRISCPVSNHADRGMVGSLTVVP